MNAKALVVLFILFAVGVASFYFSNNKGGINTAESIGSPLLPGLFEKLNDVDKIQLTGAGNNIVTTLEKNEKHWAVTERSYYPADISKIRSVVLALAEAKIIEEKITLLKKIQPEKENIWAVLSDDVSIDVKSYKLSKENSTFSKIIFDIAQFSNVGGTSKFKILRV